MKLICALVVTVMMTSYKSKRSYCVEEPLADKGAIEAIWSEGLHLKLQGVSSRDLYNYRESVRRTVKTTGIQLAGPLKLQGFS